MTEQEEKDERKYHVISIEPTITEIKINIVSFDTKKQAAAHLASMFAERNDSFVQQTMVLHGQIVPFNTGSVTRQCKVSLGDVEGQVAIVDMSKDKQTA